MQVRVLGIDTSARSGAVGLIDGDQVIFSERVTIRPGGSEQIPALIEQAFVRTGYDLRDVELIAAGVGPGSYTGVRVGLAIAKGLAFGLGLPLVGVSTLKALALNGPPDHELICTLAKSRQGEVYTGLYRRCQGLLTELSPPEIWTVAELAAELREKGQPVLFLGEALGEVEEELVFVLEEKASFGTERENIVNGAHVAGLGQAKWEETHENQLDTVLPLYLRRTEAEVRWEERSCRANVPG